MEEEEEKKRLLNLVASLQLQLNETKEQNKILNTKLESQSVQLSEVLKLNQSLNEKLDIFLSKQNPNVISTKRTKRTNNVLDDSLGGINNNKISKYFGSNSGSNELNGDPQQKITDEMDSESIPDDIISIPDDIIPQPTTSWADAAKHNPKKTDTKPTPIQLACYDRPTTKTIHDRLKKHFPDDQFSWRQLNANAPARIFTESLEFKTKIGNFLNNNSVEFNSYSEASNRKKAFIIRGLCQGNDGANTNDITQSLEKYGINGIISINRFITGNMKRNPDNASAL